MDVHSSEKDIEICAVKLHILSRTIIIITIYRSPMGNVANFLNNLEAALNEINNNTYLYRRISKHLLDEFQTSLSSEMWEKISANTLIL
jgi:hypothetical protein